MVYVLYGVLYLLVFMGGAAVFSFAGVIIWRVPRKMSFLTGRSICASCGRELNPVELIPVFSYIFLGGHCRTCKAGIPVSCLVGELAGGAVAVFSFVYYGAAATLSGRDWAESGVYFLLLALLYIIACVDADTCEIYDGFVIAVAIAALISIPVFVQPGLIDRLIGIFCVSVPLLLITLLIPGAFGGGDIKLMAAIGLFCGWKITLIGFFFAVLSGGCYGMYLLASKKKSGKEHFAFGPFLCAGIALAFPFGESLISAYLSLFKF